MIEGAIQRLGPDAESYDLEDAFVAVAHLVGGEAPDGPLAFLHEAGDVPPEQVTAIAHAIESMSTRVVRERLGSSALAALPPFGRALDDEDKEWLLAVLQGLMLFVRRAADDGAGLRILVRTDVVT